MPITLPSDALDQILSHIEDHSDILNIALSNKSSYSVAVPQHLHYRDVRTRLHNPALWSWLSRLDDLRAARIRSLTILQDNDYDFYEMTPNHIYDLRERLPPELTPSNSRPFTSYRNVDACRESETNLVAALKRMSCLRRFRWYRIPRPLLEEGTDNIWSTLRRLSTIKELDIFDGDANDVSASPIAISNTFLRIGDLTSLKLRISVFNQTDYPKIPHQLEQMLLNNFPALEVLALELDFDEQLDGTANIDRLLKIVFWPNLRVLRLRGVHCRALELLHFLIAHPKLEELALAQMMPGHAWRQLELPNNALPNLRHLECSSPQAAALLKISQSSNRPLETLLGVEFHDAIIDSDFFSWDSEWEIEDEAHEDTNVAMPSPWKALLLEGLKSQHGVTRLGIISISASQEMEVLATILPQLKEIDIAPGPDNILNIVDTEWHRLFSLFPVLEIIQGSNLIWFDSYKDDLTFEEAEKANVQVQALGRLCPRLRVILVGQRAKKAVIIRDHGVDCDSKISVGWVVRRWEESESARVKDGERIYGHKCISF